MARTLFILSAAIIKSEPGQMVYSHMQGYRVSESEDEAKGKFITAVMDEKPGFSISGLLCMAIPEETIISIIRP